jgi:delta-aminolevulinic acid dehydratase/porphobilinogen synthase
MLHDGVALLTFLGDLIAALLHLAIHPRQIRWRDVFFTMRRAGADILITYAAPDAARWLKG